MSRIGKQFISVPKQVKVKLNGQKILVDGPYFNGYIPAGEDSEMIPHECIIKGDSKSLSIAAASIIAKQYRDNIMKEIGIIYPKYNFKNNSGYGTKEHYNVIESNGLTKYHRKSFKLFR